VVTIYIDEQHHITNFKGELLPQCSILEAIIGSKPSFAWRSIHGALPIVKKGLFWRIGNGQTTQIWGDKWIPKPSTYMAHSSTTFLPREATVGELIDNQTGWWNQTLLEWRKKKLSTQSHSALQINQIDLFGSVRKWESFR
jgi:hypothetical protein